jgi:hypothetical protein
MVYVENDARAGGDGVEDGAQAAGTRWAASMHGATAARVGTAWPGQGRRAEGRDATRLI